MCSKKTKKGKGKKVTILSFSCLGHTVYRASCLCTCVTKLWLLRIKPCHILHVEWIHSSFYQIELDIGLNSLVTKPILRTATVAFGFGTVQSLVSYNHADVCFKRGRLFPCRLFFCFVLLCSFPVVQGSPTFLNFVVSKSFKGLPAVLS